MQEPLLIEIEGRENTDDFIQCTDHREMIGEYSVLLMVSRNKAWSCWYLTRDEAQRLRDWLDQSLQQS